MTGDRRGADSAPARRTWLRRAVILAAWSVLASCTSADVLRPEVDVGVETGSTAPALAGRAEPALAEPSMVAQDDVALAPEDVAIAEPVVDEFGARSLAADEEQGLADDTGLAPEPAFEPEVSRQAEPAFEPEVSRQAEPAFEPEVPRQSGPVLAGYPRFDDPIDTPEPMSADELTCRKQLKKLSVAFTELAPINQGGACRIDHPIKVSRIGKVTIKPAATLSCEMAEAFAAWTRNELVPASRWRFFSAVKTIHQGSSYSCRNIAGTRTSSEHARGNAIDIMKLELGNGKLIDVRKPGLFAFRKRGLLNTVRADGCEYFTTVLGPGYNRDHADHFHFDIKSRRNGYRACR